MQMINCCEEEFGIWSLLIISDAFRWRNRTRMHFKVAARSRIHVEKLSVHFFLYWYVSCNSQMLEILRPLLSHCNVEWVDFIPLCVFKRVDSSSHECDDRKQPNEVSDTIHVVHHSSKLWVKCNLITLVTLPRNFCGTCIFFH